MAISRKSNNGRGTTRKPNDDTTTTTRTTTTTTTTRPPTTTTSVSTTTTRPPTTTTSVSTTTTRPPTTTTSVSTTTTRPPTTTTSVTTTTTRPPTTTTTRPPTTTTTRPPTTTTTRPPTTTTTRPSTTTTGVTTTTTRPPTTTTTRTSSATTPGSIYSNVCHDPPRLAGGVLWFYNSTTVRYRCSSGYSLHGFDYILCENARWVGPMPQCVPSYSSHGLDNKVQFHKNIVEGGTLPAWFLVLVFGCVGVVALTAVIAIFLCCLHLLGCYSGPVMTFGAKHIYPKKHLCTCKDYCCCCCRCCKFCKMCCTGDDGTDDPEEDGLDAEHSIGILENEKQYPPQSDIAREL